MSAPAGAVPAVLTPEQREAVERRAGPLSLHAAAGSGKTSVLVERFVRAVLEDGVGVDRILAITFTERAAAELKARIRERLLAAGERDLARDAERAWVSTIHGFCARVLRAHPLAAGIDPDFRVLDEPEAARLAAQAFDRALEDFLGGADADGGAPTSERVELVAAYAPDALAATIRGVHDRLRSRGEREPALPEAQAPDVRPARARLAGAVAAAREGLGHDAGTSRAVDAALEALAGCQAALGQLGEDEPGDPWRFERFRVARGQSGALQGPALEELDAALEAFLDACRAHRALPDLRLLDELLSLYGRRYAETKEDASALDFEDLQLLARDLLRAQPALRDGLRERFEHVMVDEFQDTNRLQNELLDLVFDSNLFTVGDELQSIYRFRHADVDVFREHRDAAEAEGTAARLSVNFRSAPEILDALNLAFAEAFGEGFTPLRAPEREHRGTPEPGAARGGGGAERDAPPVELLVVDDRREGWEALGEQPFGPSMAGFHPWRAAEARVLARRVAALTSPGGGFAPGDVAVLVRSRTDVAVYERALAERGLPTYVAGGTGYWSQQQVADLRAYLAALANPLDETALMSALASPLAGVSLDGLVILSRRAHGMKRDVWWAMQQAFLPDGDGSEALADAVPAADRERIAAFARRFEAERAAAPRTSLERIVDRAVTDSGYDRTVLAMPQGGRRMANVRKLMRLAREFEAVRGRDLRGFIDAIDDRGIAGREGEAPLEGEHLDAVRLMTIHAAKGLEFPVVCVADLGREPQRDRSALRVAPDGRVGLRVRAIGGEAIDGLHLADIREADDRADDEEERRLVYVAATRAQRHLILSGATRFERWPEAGVLCAPMRWAWRSFVPELAEQVDRGAAAGASPRELEGRTVRVGWTAVSPATLDEVLPPGERAGAAEEVAQDGALDAAQAPQPPVSPPAEADGGPIALPVARLSYSALESHRRCGYRFFLERVLGLPRIDPPEAGLARLGAEPPEEAAGGQLALDVKGGPARPPGRPVGALDPLVRGSIVHELLERLDFSRPVVPTEEEIAEQIRMHGEDAGPAAVADVSALAQAFVDSPLCARIAAAGSVRAELPFAFSLDLGDAWNGEPLLVDGIVDVHAHEGDSALVVDYKTDEVGGEDLEALCAHKYGTQRLVYALAALRDGVATVEVVHAFLERPAEPVSVRYEAADAAALERELRGLAGALLRGRFEPTGDPHFELCATCPGRPSLCHWPPERTLAPGTPERAASPAP